MRLKQLRLSFESVLWLTPAKIASCCEEMFCIPDKNITHNTARCDFKYPKKRTCYSSRTLLIPRFENHCFFRLRLCRFFPFWEVVSRSASLWLFCPDCVLYWPYFAFIELHTCQWSSHFKLQHHSKYLSIFWTVLSIRYVALYHCKKMFWFYILARPFAKTTASWKKIMPHFAIYLSKILKNCDLVLGFHSVCSSQCVIYDCIPWVAM